MKAEVQEIDVLQIKRSDALELKNEINRLSEGNLAFNIDKYPRLWELYQLLNGCFDSFHSGVHFIQRRGE